METAGKKILRATSQEEIQPLVDLCKAGKLFDVQEWIASGKTVNPPEYQNHRVSRKSPLEIAVETGFHSLVKVLLEGGAVIERAGYAGAMERALQMRRFDLIQLLVEHGYDVKSTPMDSVFAAWDADVMEYFIERGADVEKGNPLASALCSRIRTALRILKRYWDRFPSFQEQANIALRYHCREGNVKWVSLMLWAGADPYAPGSDTPECEFGPEYDGLSALGYAALYGHFEIFRLKKIRLNPSHPVAWEIMRFVSTEAGMEVLAKLLEKGMNPNNEENGGCSAIDSLLNHMSFGARHFRPSFAFDRGGADSSRTREMLKIIHLLARHGAKWVPKDTRQINAARKSLVSLAADYTIEFMWIMAKYQACKKSDIEQLLRTPKIKQHISRYQQRVSELLADWN